MTDTVSASTIDPDGINRQEEWADALSALRTRSSFSFKALAAAIGRPTTTVHGWFSGRHLPYQRDNADVERMLVVLGVTDPTPWMGALARCRDDGPAAQVTNPYPGLMPFTEDDAPRFFGREQLVSAIRSAIARGDTADVPSPTIVIGASGSGKTSTLRAGVVPALHADGISTRYTTPASDRNAARAAFGTDTPPRVLIVDQFEEVLRESPEVIEATVGALTTFAESGHEVVIGLRSDFFHRAAQIPWLLGGLDDRQVIVTPPAHDAMADLINGPAATAGLTVESRLTVRLVDEFRDHDGSTAALPLLSYVLSRLVETRRGDELTVEAYEAEGRLDHALERAAERAYASLGADSQERTAVMFKQMVELGGDSLPTRRTVSLAELEAMFEHDGTDLDDVLSAFTAERLIVVDRDAVVLNHESILTAWPRLAMWLEEERAALGASHQLRTARTLWQEAGEDDGMLLRGRALDRAEETSGDPAAAARLTPDDRRYVAASAAVRDRDDDRRRRRTRVLAGLTVVAALAAGLAMVFAVRATQASARAEDAQGAALSRQLALQSTVLRPTDASLSRQLALVAYDTAPTLEARSALIDASADMPTARYLGESGSTALAVAAGGSRIAFSNSVAGSITIMRPTDDGEFEREMELPLPDPEVDIYALALSPDGSRLVSGGTDLFASLWDLDGDREPQVLDDAKALFELPVQSVAFAPDGQTIFASGTSTGIGVWNADDDPASTSDLLPAAGSTMAIDHHPDRQLLAAANLDGTATLIDLTDPREPVWQLPSDTAANTVDISPDGNTLVLGYRSGVFRSWDLTDLGDITETSPAMEPFGTWVNSVRFSPDGSRLAAGSDGSIRVWDTSTWAEIGSVSTPNLVTNIRYLSDDTGLAALADGSVRTFDLSDLSLQTLGATIWSTSFTPDGERLLASSRERTTVWQVEDGQTTGILAEIPPPDPDVGFSGTNAVSPDGRFAALGSRSGPVWFVDLDDLGAEPVAVTGLATLVDELTETQGSAVLVENVSFSADSAVLGAMGGDGYVQLWRVNDGQPTRAAGLQIAGFSRNIVFHPTEPILSVASDNGLVSLYNISDPMEPELLTEIETGSDGAYGMAFHPTQDILAAGNSDKTLTVWDLSDVRAPVLLERVTGPNSRLYDVAYDATGDRLVAAVGDNTTWLWDSSDPAAHEVESVLSLSSGGVYAAAFSPDGRTLAAAGSDQRVFLWSLDAEQARARVCSNIGDEITEDEWTDLVPTLTYRSPCS